MGARRETRSPGRHLSSAYACPHGGSDRDGRPYTASGALRDSRPTARYDRTACLSDSRTRRVASDRTRDRSTRPVIGRAGHPRRPRGDAAERGTGRGALTGARGYDRATFSDEHRRNAACRGGRRRRGAGERERVPRRSIAADGKRKPHVPLCLCRSRRRPDRGRRRYCLPEASAWLRRLSPRTRMRLSRLERLVGRRR